MVEVLNSGFYTTVQDLGRYQFQEFGVPISGAMDSYSAKIANALVGNNENDAVLEMTVIGCTLKFQFDALVSIVGADSSIILNSKKVEMHCAIKVSKDDILTIGKMTNGSRSYLAISEGFNTETVMKSRSMYQGITSKFRIEKGDTLKIGSASTNIKKYSNSLAKVKVKFSNHQKINVSKGPEFDLLSANQKKQLLNTHFTISKNNSRMAYQIEEPLNHGLDGILTSLVLPGTVQLTTSGKLILLMRDCQTTGGYARVLQLTETAINSVSQKFTEDFLQFKLIN